MDILKMIETTDKLIEETKKLTEKVVEILQSDPRTPFEKERDEAWEDWLRQTTELRNQL